MSFITKADLELMEKKYGRPVSFKTEFTMMPDEYAELKQSQKNGRAHDITMFIFHDDMLLFIAKHPYPDGLYRAPSGGVWRGESIVEGAKREAFEETGAEIELERYLAKIDVRFYNGNGNKEYTDWTSYVFKARYLSGEIEPHDKDEIREAKFIQLSDIHRFDEMMRKSDVGGFHYRAYLSEQIMKLLKSDIDRLTEIKSQKHG